MKQLRGGDQEERRRVGLTPEEARLTDESHKVLDFESFKAYLEDARRKDAAATPEQKAETARQLANAGKLYEDKLTKMNFVYDLVDKALKKKVLPAGITSEAIDTAKVRVNHRAHKMREFRDTWAKLVATTAGAGILSSVFGHPEGIYIAGGLMFAEGAGLMVSETILSRAIRTQAKLNTLGRLAEL